MTTLKDLDLTNKNAVAKYLEGRENLAEQVYECLKGGHLPGMWSVGYTITRVVDSYAEMENLDDVFTLRTLAAAHRNEWDTYFTLAHNQVAVTMAVKNFKKYIDKLPIDVFLER